jgi:hypothetical protein
VGTLSILTELALAGLQRLIVPQALRSTESGKNEPFTALVAGEMATEMRENP